MHCKSFLASWYQARLFFFSCLFLLPFSHALYLPPGYFLYSDPGNIWVLSSFIVHAFWLSQVLSIGEPQLWKQWWGVASGKCSTTQMLLMLQPWPLCAPVHYYKAHCTVLCGPYRKAQVPYEGSQRSVCAWMCVCGQCIVNPWLGIEDWVGWWREACCLVFFGLCLSKHLLL